MSKIGPVGLLLLASLWIQTAAAEDLMTIYGLALQQDAELLIAEDEYLAAIENVPLAESADGLQLFFNANGSLRESDNSETGSNSTDTLGYSVDLSKSLYNTDISNDISAAEATAAARFAELEATRQALILRVAETYFDILAARDNVEFAYAERKAIERQLEQAQKRFEVGLIAITDVQEAQARFDSAEAQAIQAENGLETAFQALTVITGQTSIRELIPLGDNLELTLPDPADAEQWVDRALQNNRQLQAARQNLNAARFARDKSSNNRSPSLDLTASFADSYVNDDLLDDYDQKDVTVGLQLQIPLYTGGRIGAERAQADAEFRAAQNAVLLQNRLASQQTRTAYLDVLSGISQVKAFAQALESSNVALEATQAGFEVGTRTSVDVLVSLRETFRAQRDFASSRYDYLVNNIRLKQAAGILNEDDLIDMNRWLTP